MERISKKELLRETGISYGQLYRWKRQRLIPEEWFVKQAAQTGQETFFPREQILRRIQAILELKDRYSLEDLAQIFSPQQSNARLSREELEGLGVNSSLFRLLDTPNPEDFSFSEAQYLLALSRAVDEDGLPAYMAAGLAKSGMAAARALQSTGAVITFFKAGGGFHVIFTTGLQPPAFDSGVDVIAQYSTEELADRIKSAFTRGKG